MKPQSRFGTVLAIALVFASLAWAQKKVAVRSKTDNGFWYVKSANPQRISHYMREAGLTYLEEIQTDYEAHRDYGIELTDATKSASESEDATVGRLEDRMKINTQAPADKDFLSVMIHTGGMASLAGNGVGLCAGGSMPKEECDTRLSRYIACKSWVKESIDSGIFDDSWHADCYGDWDEEHKQAK